MNKNLNPSRIMETVTAFWPSKVLLTAVEFDLFTVLSTGEKNAAELARQLKIHPRRSLDFFDALVALDFLQRKGNGDSALYSNTDETETFLTKGKATYMGGMPEMLNARLFGIWNSLGEALRTGKVQNESKTTGASVFEALYANQDQLEQFLSAMAGFQTGAFMALSEKFDFSKRKTIADIGGANGHLCKILLGRHQHLQATLFDLPPVIPIAEREAEKAGLQKRLQCVAGDFFADALPKSEVITMGMILHDWSEKKKKTLIKSAFHALPKDGVFIAIDNIIDDERRKNAFGLMMSLNMLLEFGADGGFDYTGAQFDSWCKEAGFSRTEIVPLVGPVSAAIAYK